MHVPGVPHYQSMESVAKNRMRAELAEKQAAKGFAALQCVLQQIARGSVRSSCAGVVLVREVSICIWLDRADSNCRMGSLRSEKICRHAGARNSRAHAITARAQSTIQLERQPEHKCMHKTCQQARIRRAWFQQRAQSTTSSGGTARDCFRKCTP